MPSTAIVDAPKGNVVPVEEIRRFLAVYRDAGVFITEATFDGRVLVARLRTFAHPFTKSNPRHLTREHILVFLTQSAYLISGLLCEHNPDWPISADDFVELALAEQGAIARLNIRLRRFLANRDGHVMETSCIRSRASRTRVFIELSFQIGSAVEGTYDVVLAADRSFTISKT